jgi:hypothetical protein
MRSKFWLNIIDKDKAIEYLKRRSKEANWCSLAILIVRVIYSLTMIAFLSVG